MPHRTLSERRQRVWVHEARYVGGWEGAGNSARQCGHPTGASLVKRKPTETASERSLLLITEVTRMERALDRLWTALTDKRLPAARAPPRRRRLRACCAHCSTVYLHLSDLFSFFLIRNKKGSGSERLSKLLDIPGQ